MRLVYKFNIRQNEGISSLCKVSNNLYNQALYVFRETLSDSDKWLSYFELDVIMKKTKNLDGEINYRLLKAQCSQQILKVLDKSIKGYCKSVQDYKKHPGKYKARPHLPNYRKRGSEFNLYYPNQSCQIRNGKIILSKELSIDIPQYEKYSDLIKNFKQVRIKPLMQGYKVEIIYEVKDVEVRNRKEKVASIDLGIGNLATLISENSAILFSGKFIKSYNQFFNKVSRKIVDLLVGSNITKLVVGYNKGWKQNIDMGKRNNQKFTQIPFARLISYLEYKCELARIEIITNEESYTSKCDSLAFEVIGKHDSYLGRRKKRGLFQSSTGRIINADVNGALNIMRKVFGDSCESVHRIIDRGLLFNPIRITNVFDKMRLETYKEM